MIGLGAALACCCLFFTCATWRKKRRRHWFFAGFEGVDPNAEARRLRALKLEAGGASGPHHAGMVATVKKKHGKKHHGKKKKKHKHSKGKGKHGKKHRKKNRKTKDRRASINAGNRPALDRAKGPSVTRQVSQAMGRWQHAAHLTSSANNFMHELEREGEMRPTVFRDTRYQMNVGGADPAHASADDFARHAELGERGYAEAQHATREADSFVHRHAEGGDGMGAAASADADDFARHARPGLTVQTSLGRGKGKLRAAAHRASLESRAGSALALLGASGRSLTGSARARRQSALLNKMRDREQRAFDAVQTQEQLDRREAEATLAARKRESRKRHHGKEHRGKGKHRKDKAAGTQVVSGAAEGFRMSVDTDGDGVVDNNNLAVPPMLGAIGRGGSRGSGDRRSSSARRLSAFMGGRGSGTPRGGNPGSGSFRGAHRQSVVMRAMVRDEAAAFSELHHAEEAERQRQLAAIIRKKRQSHAKHHASGPHSATSHPHVRGGAAVAPMGSDAYIDLEAADSPGPSSRRTSGPGSRRGIVMGMGDAQRKSLEQQKKRLAAAAKKKKNKKSGKKGKKGKHKKSSGKKGKKKNRKKHGAGL